jgi:hypothetical protein
MMRKVSGLETVEYDWLGHIPTYDAKRAGSRLGRASMLVLELVLSEYSDVGRDTLHRTCP